MFGGPIARAVSSFSLFLIFVTAVCADDYSSIRNRLHEAKPSAARPVLKDLAERNAVPAEDDELSQAIDQASREKGDASLQISLDRINGLLDLRVAATHTGAPANGSSAQQQAAAIKASPLYRDEGLTEDSNWLSKAFERLRNLLTPKGKPPRMNAPTIPGVSGLMYVVWFLLAAIVITFLVFVLREVRIRKRHKRRARAMLEDDEPDRTLDEWLTLADSLTRDGKYREAVRALYLSCLLKFDETRVSRFVRGETNWEHLHRINASPKKPADIDFLPPTQAFDRVWYGNHVRGIEDVEEFRGWYERITRSLAEVKP